MGAIGASERQPIPLQIGPNVWANTATGMPDFVTKEYRNVFESAGKSVAAPLFVPKQYGNGFVRAGSSVTMPNFVTKECGNVCESAGSYFNGAGSPSHRRMRPSF